MKLSREILKSLIKEELGNLDEEVPEAAPEPTAAPVADEPKGDVAKALMYLQKIDQPKEGQAFLDAVINHIAKIRNGNLILKNLKNKLNAGMTAGPGA